VSGRVRARAHAGRVLPVLAALFLIPQGCARSAPLPPASPAPELAVPSRALPADLDLALRADLSQLRRAFGPAAVEALELRIADPERDPPEGALLRDALAQADFVWVALRPGRAPHLTDNVVVLRGSFGKLAIRDYPGENRWGAPVDLGADLRRHDRSPPSRRSAPARLYVLSDTLIVFVSEAAIDSVARRIEERAEDARVEPPERGMVSFAARVPPMLRHIEGRSARLAQALAEASNVEAHVSLDSVGLRGRIEVHFSDAREAGDAAASVQQLLASLGRLGGALGEVPRGARVEALADRLVLELALDTSGTAALLGCVIRGEGC
jgi:hypothetical protein